MRSIVMNLLTAEIREDLDMSSSWLCLPGGNSPGFVARARRVLPGVLAEVMHILPLRGDMCAFDA